MQTLLRRTGLTLAGALIASQALWATPQSFEVDPVHSSINFSVRHFFSPVQGNFKKFTGSIKWDKDKPANSSVTFTVQADSVSTDNEKRDAHLKSDSFFDVTKYSTLTFESKKVTVDSSDKNKLNVVGTLTMHGVSQSVTVPVRFLGSGKGMQGAVAGFETDFQLNRKDYGIVWNKTLDGGGTMLGDDINVRLTVEADAKS